MEESLSIVVEVDDLIDRLSEIQDDEFELVELKIEADSYSKRLIVKSSSFDENESVTYGEMPEASEEIY